MKNMFTVPGFGGGGGVPAMPPMPAPSFRPTPPPVKPPPPKPQDVRNKEAEERTGSAKRQARIDAAKAAAAADLLSDDVPDSLL
jgi:hypothetical protein